MKILNLFFALSLLIFAASCGDDEDPNSGESQFVGTWKADSFSADVSSVSSIIGQAGQSTSVDIEGVNMDYTVELNESPMNFTTSGSYDIEGEVIAASITQPINDSYDNVTGSGTYRIEGDSLFTVGAFFDVEVNGISTAIAQGETASMITLVDSKMVIEQEVTTEDSPIPGFTTTTTIISRSVWSKQ